MAHSARNSRIVAPPPTCVSTSPRPNRGPFRSEMAAPDILSDGMSRYPQVQAERHVSLESMYFRDCFSRGYRLLGQQLGRGSYAKVRLAVIEKDKYMERTAQHAQRHKLNTFDIEKVAVKIVDKRLAPRAYTGKVLPREIAAHKMVSGNKFVVEFIETFETPTHYYCMMENCANGNLLHFINARARSDGGGLPETCARKLFHQLCDAVDYCHSKNVVHRNIKCENLLLDDNFNLKLSDFSVSALVPANYKLLKRPCGSFSYAAPELINHQVYEGALIDAWSVGVVLYAMLNRCLPFSVLNPDALYEDMRNQRFRFHRTITTEAMILVREILQADPCRRLPIPAIRETPWYRGLKIPLQQLHEAMEQGKYSVKEKPLVGKQESLTLPIPDYKSSRMRSRHASVSVGSQNKETILLKSKMPDKNLAYAIGYDQVARPSECHMRQKVNERSESMLQLEVIHSPQDLSPRSPNVVDRRCPSVQDDPNAICVRGHNTSRRLTRSAVEQLDALQTAGPGYRVLDDNTCQLLCDCGRPIILKVKEVQEDGTDLPLELQCEYDDPNPPVEHSTDCKNAGKLWITFEERLREIQKYIEDLIMKSLPEEKENDTAQESDSFDQCQYNEAARKTVTPVSDSEDSVSIGSAEERLNSRLSLKSEALPDDVKDDDPPADAASPVGDAEEHQKAATEQPAEEAGEAASPMEEEDLPATPAEPEETEPKHQRAKSAFAGPISELTSVENLPNSTLRGCRSHMSDVSQGPNSYNSYGPTTEGNCAVLSKLSDSVIAKLVAIETIMMSNHRTASQLSFLKKELMNESKRNSSDSRKNPSQNGARSHQDMETLSQSSELSHYSKPAMRPYLTSTDPSLQNRMSIYDKDARRQNRTRARNVSRCSNHCGTEPETTSLRDFRTRKVKRASFSPRLHLPPLDVSTMPKFANATNARRLLESRPKCRMGQFDPSSSFTKQYLYLEKSSASIPYTHNKADARGTPLTCDHPAPRKGLAERQKQAMKSTPKLWHRTPRLKRKPIEDVRRMLGHVPSTVKEAHRRSPMKMLD